MPVPFEYVPMGHFAAVPEEASQPQPGRYKLQLAGDEEEGPGVVVPRGHLHKQQCMAACHRWY